MKIEDFLEERIQEVALETSDGLDFSIVKLCVSVMQVLTWHRNWPVLVETEPMIVRTPLDLNDMCFEMTKRMEWLTKQEYIAKFGSEPPTAPLLRIMAANWSDHPDWQEEWRLT